MTTTQEPHDERLVCADCNTEFLFSVKEQAFFVEKKYVPPKRCPVCRKKRRDAKVIST